MRRFATLACVAAILLSPLLFLYSQQFNAYRQLTFSATGSDIALSEQTVIAYHQLSWTASGTVSTCAVTLDSSPDGTTWNAGGVITSQNCATGTNSAVVNATANYVRITVATLTGGGTITITYKGWVNNPSGGSAVTSVFGRTGVVVAASNDYTCAQTTNCTPNTTTVNGHALSSNVTVTASDVSAVPTTTTVNTHPLSSNVVVSATDLTTGTLPHAQLPALVSGDIPANAANTSGTAANLSGTPALPNGTTATTQTAGDNSTKLSTTAYTDTARLAASADFISFCQQGVGTSNATAYTLAPASASGTLCSSSSTDGAPVPITHACTVHAMYANASAAGGAAGSGVVAIYKNGGSASAVTCTLGTGTSCNDTTHTLTFAAGDKWSVRVTTGQASDTTANIRVAFQCY